MESNGRMATVKSSTVAYAKWIGRTGNLSQNRREYADGIGMAAPDLKVADWIGMDSGGEAATDCSVMEANGW
jgi:hypothetical protein